MSEFYLSLFICLAILIAEQIWFDFDFWFIKQHIMLWDDCIKMCPSREIYVADTAGYLVT